VGAINSYLVRALATAPSLRPRLTAIIDDVARPVAQESGLFGVLLNCPDEAFNECASASASRTTGSELEEQQPPPLLYLNTHEPFCLVATGVQGAGKSHTMGVVLENVLLPVMTDEAHGPITLANPMAALVLHYDQSASTTCEATGLINETPHIAELVAGIPSSSSAFDSRPISTAPHLPRDKMVVLVSPTYYKQRKAFYGDYCRVQPLLFQWKNLTAKQIKALMRINDGDTQLYISVMLDKLRRYEREDVIPAFETFMGEMEEACTSGAQRGPFEQRKGLLQSIIADSTINAALRSIAGDVASIAQAGQLIVADLTDPMMSPEDANCIFQVLVEQFRAAHLEGSGKLLALDEAHKYMTGDTGDSGLSRQA
jgi:hypothetical protein